MITVYNKREASSSTIYVKKISESIYQMVDNDVLNCDLTLGTEFEAMPNNNGELEVIRIIKKSQFITRRFFLNNQFKESDYRVLGDEIMKIGGFWQVDLGSIATINLPQSCPFDIDEAFKIFGFTPTEIVD